MFRVIPWCTKCDKKVDDFERIDLHSEFVQVDAYCHGRRDTAYVNEYPNIWEALPDLSKLTMFEDKKAVAPDDEI